MREKASPPSCGPSTSNPGRRRELWRQARKDVGKVFILALVLDAIYQVIVHSGIYALELLFTATILALVPYLLVRGLSHTTRTTSIGRVADRWPARGSGIPGRRPATKTKGRVT